MSLDAWGIIKSMVKLPYFHRVLAAFTIFAFFFSPFSSSLPLLGLSIVHADATYALSYEIDGDSYTDPFEQEVIITAIGYFGITTRAFMKAASLGGLWW